LRTAASCRRFRAVRLWVCRNGAPEPGQIRRFGNHLRRRHAKGAVLRRGVSRPRGRPGDHKRQRTTSRFCRAIGGAPVSIRARTKSQARIAPGALPRRCCGPRPGKLCESVPIASGTGTGAAAECETSTKNGT
jgi:hypothetical protein